MNNRNIFSTVTVALVCLLLAACGGGSDSSSDTGKLSLSITDAPIYYAQLVEIDVIGVEVKPESGPALKFNVCEDPNNNLEVIIQKGDCTVDSGVITIDLLQYTGGASFMLLDGVDVPAGRVNWVRLRLTDPAGRIELPGGGLEILTVPSGSQTGLKLNRGFDVLAGVEIRVFIDFDVRKSIVEDHGKYKLKPTLRLVDKFGAIAGTVDSSLRPVSCLGPSVYVFEGTAATPDDIDRGKDDPVSSAMVNNVGSYRADFLAPGDYRVAFICAEGGPAGEPEDDPDRDDLLIIFTPPADKPATVVDEQTVQIDFLVLSRQLDAFALAQVDATHLAGGGHRQFIDELDLARVFVRG